MATIAPGHTSLVALDEEYGVVKRLVLRYRLKLTSGENQGDWTNLAVALSDSNVPAYNEYPSVNWSNLICVRRSANVIEGDPSMIDVDCEFTSRGLANTNFVFSGYTSLQQQDTQVDVYGNQITCSHTYSGDPDYGSATITQGKSVSALLPMTTVQATGILRDNYPAVTSDLWTGRVNETWWGGGAPGTWLCTNVQWTPHDVSVRPARIRFTFEFQYNRLGWQPDVWFTHPPTGEPPSGIVAGVGAKTVAIYPTLNFHYLFAA